MQIHIRTLSKRKERRKLWIVGGFKGMNKVQNTLRKRYNNINHEGKD